MTVLYNRNIFSLSDCESLQVDLDSLAHWESDWQMKFNVAKCHSMRVTRHSPLKQIKYSLTLHNQTLEQVTSAKYLGITITDNLDWGQHVSDVTTKATQTLGFLRRNLALAPGETKDMAYKTLVRPKLEYASPVLPLDLQALAEHDMFNELEWPTLEYWREAILHTIHSGTVAIERNKYLTPAPRLRQTRAFHELQYTYDTLHNFT